MGALNVLILLVLLTVAFLFRHITYALSVSMAAAGISMSALYASIAETNRRMLWSVVKAATVYRRSIIRVSLSYLIAIHIDDRYLLVRGRRIRTQFQPVGGVYKTRLGEPELLTRFQATADTRFKPDQANQDDLRLRLPGGKVRKLLRWFESGQEREYLPFREFYEELVHTNLLDPRTFAVIDCQPAGRRSLGLSYDRWSGCQQLIAADIWILQPSPAQEAELRKLRDRRPVSRDLLFATQEEILSGGRRAVTKATFDIAPTAVWILESSP